jgi:hypothetical protein
MDDRRQIGDNDSMARKLSRHADPWMLDKSLHRQLADLAVMCVPILVSGCAETDLFSPVAPGKYDFLDCASIAKRLAKASYQEAQLAQLMTRASQAADGAVVNAIAYQDRYMPALELDPADDRAPGLSSTRPIHGCF